MDQNEMQREICAKIFSLAGGRQTEVIMFSGETGLTRFADNAISQNVSGRSTDLIIRVMEKGKVARTVLNQTGDKWLKAGVEKAIDMLKMQKPDPDLPDLPEPLPIPENKSLFDVDTAMFAPAQRAEKLAELVKTCRKRGRSASGILESGWNGVTMANSNRVFTQHRESSATFSVTVNDSDGCGWAEKYSHRIGDIDFDAVGRRAQDKAAAAKNPRAIKPGRYTVILEPDPVANLLVYAAIYGFGGQFFIEGQSFMSGKMGRKLLGGNISVEDNALDEPAAGMPFDFEGMPRQRVLLIDKGVAKNVVNDRKTAKMLKTVSTGHALPQPNTYGPISSFMRLSPGAAALGEMIKNTKQGLLVTQFHYVNLLKPLTLEITGMTRNGTYWIENGEIAFPVKNMRFTESVVEALNRVEEVGRDRETIPAFSGGKFLVPAIKIKDFNFSSVTQF